MTSYSPCAPTELFEDDNSLVSLVANESLTEVMTTTTVTPLPVTPALTVIDREPVTPRNITESHGLTKRRKFVKHTCKYDLVEPDGSQCALCFLLSTT